MSKDDKPADWRDYLAPPWWGTWVLLGLMRLLALLSMSAGIAVGNVLGALLYKVAVKRRRVTEVNIRLCFPELSAAEKTELVKKVFKANAIGFVETAWAYWGDTEYFRKRTEFVGFELLEEALKQQKGVILLGGHFSTLDLGGLLLSFYGVPFDCVYRPHNNALMDYWICKKRSRFTKVVDRKKFREMLRDLRKNRCIWYAPDQDFGAKGAVFVPFFGQAAATIVATTKMVRLNDSPILMLSHHRNADNRGYTVEVAAMPEFPSGDETRDAELVNQALEQAVRKAPEQYMWVHKRFKTQPDGNQKLYKAAGC